MLLASFERSNRSKSGSFLLPGQLHPFGLLGCVQKLLQGGEFLVASYELALVTAANLHIGTRFRLLLRLVLRYRDWGRTCQW